MQIRNELGIGNASFSMDLTASGDVFGVLQAAGRTLAECGTLRCGKFAEAGNPLRKLRSHLTEDGLSGSLDFERTIPFGCEYHVRRDVEVCSGFVRVTTDVTANMQRSMGRLELDPLFFPGEWTAAEIFDGREMKRFELSGETEKKVLYDAPEVPLLIRLTAPDGVMAEYGCGTDLWRQSFGGAGRFTVTSEGNGVRFTRVIFELGSDVETWPEKKMWRFKYLLSWHVPGGGEKAALPEKCVPAPSACLCAPAEERKFKKLIRSGIGGIRLVMENAAPHLCADSSHQERPGRGELPHYDLENFLLLYLWANRSARRNGGGALNWHFAAGSELAGGAFASAMGRDLEQLEVRK